MRIKARDDIKGLREAKIINAAETSQRKCGEPTNTGLYRRVSLFPIGKLQFSPHSRHDNFLGAFCALLITIRHARRFVRVGFSRKQATDHNQSTNHNRSSEQAEQCSTAGDVCAPMSNRDLWIVECECKQVFR